MLFILYYNNEKARKQILQPDTDYGTESRNTFRRYNKNGF